MLPIFRLILVALVLETSANLVGLQPVRAQGAESPSAPQQITLTQAEIDNLLATQPEMAALQQQQAQSAQPDQPDAKLQGKAETIAKKHGFANLSAYEQAVDSVAMVLAGMDPETKSYVGPAILIKKQMKLVAADKTLPPIDKDKALKDMKEALAAATDAKPAPGNVDLVAKNYDKLAEAFQNAD